MDITFETLEFIIGVALITIFAIGVYVKREAGIWLILVGTNGIILSVIYAIMGRQVILLGLTVGFSIILMIVFLYCLTNVQQCNNTLINNE